MKLVNGAQWKVAGMVLLAGLSVAAPARADDLADLKARGVLRHLGVPYATFVTGSGDGMDVELMQKFAEYLGVRYEFVKTDWGSIIGDLSGQNVRPAGNDVEILGEVPVRGDVIACGLTILPWREKVVDYGSPTFPNQVWLIARNDSALEPIRPSGKIDEDIAVVKALLPDRTVLCKAKTCLDPSLYKLEATQAHITIFAGNLNELAPAVINGEAEATILDVPDSLVALQKWPGQIKVIGPISPEQQMACAFAKSSPRLREAFNLFLALCQQDGTYERLVKKYYPTATAYYPDFFRTRFGSQPAVK
jgi:ABC-type amino acid transport substrate-binding protein